MTGTLNVEPSKLKETAGTFQATGNQIKNLTDQMMTTVKSLTGEVWSGEAASAYVNKFTQLEDDIRKMLSMINEHVTELQEMASGYESAESANMDIINNLEGDVII